MLVEHVGLMLWLMLGAVGQAAWAEAVLGRNSGAGWVLWLKALLLIGPIVLTPMSELVAREASDQRVRLWALWVCVGATSVYLTLNVCCAMLPWRLEEPALVLASTVPSTVVAGLCLRWALRSIVTGTDGGPYDDLRERPRSWAHAIERESSLLGGTALSMAILSFSLAGLAAAGLWNKPDRWREVGSTLVFFTVCGLVSVKIALLRRATMRAAQGL
jgi:hypothetical protein